MTPRKFVFLLCCAVFGSVVFHHYFSASSQAVAAQARIVRVAAASGAVGGTINIPIEIVSQGDENAIGFSLTFDAAVLGNPVATLGSDATGATINTNASQAAQGRFGLALAFPASQKFTAGVRQLAVVTFSVAGSANFGTTNLGFGDQPVVREVADTSANALTTTFTGGAVTLTKGFEADVNPRPDGDNNGQITITDWVQVGKFVAGLDTAAPGSEFQRADCAPRSGLGDGRISIIDWAQAGRYAAALDPATPAGGPTMAGSPLMVVGGSLLVAGDSHQRNPVSTVRALQQPETNHRPPTTSHQLTIEIDAQGIENALGFSLIFNASHWRLLSVKAGRNADGAILHINSTEADRGRIGVALAMPVGQAIARGERELVVCEFAAIANRKGLPLIYSFGDFPVRREMADVEANLLIGNFTVEGVQLDSPHALSSKLAKVVFEPGQPMTIPVSNFATITEATADPEVFALAGATVAVIDCKNTLQFARMRSVSQDVINCLLPVGMSEGTATLIVANSNGDSFRTLIEITRR